MIYASSSDIPDRAACLDIMERFGMPAHVRRHSETVCRVALYLTERLLDQGAALDAGLVRAGALLHDVTKHHSFQSALDHSLTGAKVVGRLGFPKAAAVVRQHVRLSTARPAGRLSEVEVVNYADKRVLEDRVVSLDERLDYIFKRYARTPEARVWIEAFARESRVLEREIFSVIDGGPEQLSEAGLSASCQ